MFMVSGFTNYTSCFYLYCAATMAPLFLIYTESLFYSLSVFTQLYTVSGQKSKW